MKILGTILVSIGVIWLLIIFPWILVVGIVLTGLAILAWDK
jgi:hypothetical protein